jgi:hypothetical protein
MKTVRILAMVVLALLYLGGTYAHLSGVAFPVVGTGNKAYDTCSGKTKEPIRPIITECRHIPLVKVVEVSPAFPVAVTAFEHREEYQVVSTAQSSSGLLTVLLSSCSSRAPPRVQAC